MVMEATPAKRGTYSLYTSTGRYVGTFATYRMAEHARLSLPSKAGTATIFDNPAR